MALPAAKRKLSELTGRALKRTRADDPEEAHQPGAPASGLPSRSAAELQAALEAAQAAQHAHEKHIQSLQEQL